jgi:hypothetical protein
MATVPHNPVFSSAKRLDDQSLSKGFTWCRTGPICTETEITPRGAIQGTELRPGLEPLRVTRVATTAEAVTDPMPSSFRTFPSRLYIACECRP